MDTALWLFSLPRPAFPKSYILGFNVFATVSLKDYLGQPHGLTTSRRPILTFSVFSSKNRTLTNQCVCVSLFKSMPKIWNEHWNNDILLHLPRTSFPKGRQRECMCLHSSSSKVGRKPPWSEDGDKTCSIFRGLLFQKDWSLFSCVRDSSPQNPWWNRYELSTPIRLAITFLVCCLRSTFPTFEKRKIYGCWCLQNSSRSVLDCVTRSKSRHVERPTRLKMKWRRCCSYNFVKVFVPN